MKAKRKSLALLLAIVLAMVLTVTLAACTKTYTITFDSAGGSAVGSITVKGKESPSAPNAPTKEGHTFEKWIKPNGDEFLFGTDTVEENLTLTAIWSKNTYTVRFVTGGGTSISPQSVGYNEKATRPDDPNKSGEIFCDWYKDSGYKELFDFETAIKSDTTVYARFELPSMYTYKVSFAGTAVAIADRETNEAGILTNLPKPEESGKVFAGWWMSDFEDAGKLTCEYTGQVLTQNVTLFAVWESENPEVSVNESGVYWASEGVNVSYRVEITAPDGNKETRTLGTTEYAYDFASKEAGEYKVEVTYNNKTTTVYYNNKALSRVSVFEVDGFVLKFNKVLNAEKYLVTVKCGNTSHEHEMSFTDMETTSGEIDFTLCEMTEEGIVFVVKAVGEGYVTSESEEYVFERHLDKVTGLSVKAEDETIIWNNVANAQYYEYQVNDGEWIRYDGTVSLKEMAAGAIVVRVRAVAHGYNSSEVAEYTYTKTRLATPSKGSIEIDGTTLKWGAVAGAVSYTVSIDGVEHLVETGSSMELPDGIDWTNMQISVRANGATEAENSLYSDVTEFAATLEGKIEYNEGYLEWPTILGASKYAVRVNGKDAVEVLSTATRYKISLDKEGTNVIEICYYDKAGEASEWARIDVTAYKVTLRYNIEGYESYATLYRAQNDPLELPADEVTLVGYDFDYWMEASNGVAYTGTKLEKAEDLTLYAHWTPKEYTVTFVVAGGTMSETTFKVTYRQGYELPTPESDIATKTFFGWYESPNKMGVKYTDNTGAGTGVWMDAGDKTLYAGWVDVFEFIKTKQSIGGGQSIEGYSVKKGEGISLLTEVKIPAEYDGLPVIDISSGAFHSCRTLKKISIPDTIKNIDYGFSGGNSTGSPFSACSNLEEIEVYAVNPDGVYETRYTSIDGVLFEYRDTDNLSDLQLNYMPVSRRGEYEIPYGVTVLPTEAFGDVNYLTYIKVPATVTRIDERAFAALYLEKIEFLAQPDGETEQTLSLDDLAFSGASNVVELVLPTRFDFSSKYFSYMTDLEKISFTNDNWDYRAIDGLVVNKAADTIIYAPRTFSGEGGVFTIPNGINKIADNAFSNVYAMTTSTTGWYGCKNITKLVIPGWVTNIGEAAFRSCSNITEIEFLGDENSASLRIAARAFHGCNSISKVTLPVNLVSLGKYAFGYCANLTEVNVQVTAGTVESDGTMRCTALETDAFRIDLDWNTANPSSGLTTRKQYTVRKLTIGSKVGIFDIGGVFGSTLQNVEIDAANPNFASEDGVVYNKSFSEIMFYPSGKEGAFTLHEDVETINAGVFAGAAYLTEITLGAKVKIISENAFNVSSYNSGLSRAEQIKSMLTKVIFATEVAEGHTLSIGASAFESCAVLTDIVLPDYVTELGSRVFAGCKALTEMTIPGSVKKVGDEAFATCHGLVTVTFEEGVEQIGQKLFSSCEGSLTTVNLPASLTVIAEGDVSPFTNMFYKCTGIDKVNIAEGNAMYASIDGVVYGYSLKGEEGSEESVLTDLLYCPVGASGVDGVVDIPKTVERISEGAFKNNKNITEIKFSEGILGDLDIGTDAFSGCQKLATITLPRGLTVMKTGLFNGCSSLVTLTIPNTVTEMQVNIFKGCSNLENIIFEEGNESTPLRMADGSYKNTSTGGAPAYSRDTVFNGCTKLNVIAFPNRLEKIPAYAFSWDNAPKELVLSESVTEIGECAFYNTYWYTGGSSSYEYVSNLKKVVFADGATPALKTIGNYAFYGCDSLVYFDFADSIETIGNNAFYDCDALTSVVFNVESSKLTTIGNSSFAQNKLLSSIVLPNSLETIGTSAFSSCTALTNVSLPLNGTLKTIEASAFSGCKALETVSIPASVETLGASVFASCTSLYQVKFEKFPVEHQNAGKNSLASIGDSAFNQTALTSFALPDSIAENGTTLGASLFNKVKTLTSIELSATVVSIESMIKGSYIIEISIPEDSRYLNADETLPLIYNSDGTMIQLTFGPLGDEEGVFRVPENTTVIGARAFSGQSFKKIILPYTVREIGEYAFENCFNLEEVVVKTDLTSGEGGYSNLSTVGEAAFKYCYSLKKIDLSRTRITRLQNETFCRCESLSEILLPDTLEIIGLETDSLSSSSSTSSVFYYCESLRSIKLPEGFKRINGSSNFNYSGLEEMVFPESMEFVADDTFQYTENLKKVTFQSAMEWKTSNSYGDIFSYSSVEEVILSDKMTTLSPNMFDNAKQLRIVSYNDYVIKNQADYEAGFENALPPQVTVAPYELFNNCESLKSMDMSNITSYAFYSSSSTGNYNGVFSGCTSLEEVTLNSTLDAIPGKMFLNCTSLVSIDLPDSLAFLGRQETFKNTGLVSIKIPAGVKGFGNTADSCSATQTVRLFENCAYLTTIIMPASMTDFEIGGYVFTGCTALKTIKAGENGEDNVLPGVTLVGQYAFTGCAIESLDLPDVDTVGTYAFGVKSADFNKGTYATKLQSISMPKLTSFNTYLFSYATELSQVTLGDDAEALSNYMFDGCASLETITLPSKLTFLGTYTFRNSGLKNIVIPDGVKHIGSSKGSAAAAGTSVYVFQNCAQLTSVTLPAGLMTLGAYVFDGCSSLSALTYSGNADEGSALPSTVTVVGNYAFRNCSSLTELAMTGLKTSGTYAFDGCSMLETVTLGSTFTAVPNYMFRNCSSMTTINLEAVKTIGTYAFQGCASLTEADISVATSVGTYAFDGCASLVKVTLNSSLTTLSNYLFRGCSSLEEINLEAIKTVGTYCFQNCVALRAAELTSATSIGNYAFNGCSELTTVKLPAVTTLGTNSFRDCVKLSNVQLNMSLKTISNSAFRGCKALELIQLPNELEKIDTYAFRESGLTLIEFPVSLTDVDFSAFGYCYNLEEITVKDTESGFYIDEESGWLMYRDGESLALLMTLGNLQGEVIVPEGVTAIGASAFEGRRSMTGVQLPSTLESIGRLAFWQTGITKIVIPAGVKEIGDQAFAYSSVQSAELNCKDAFIDASVFANCSALISVSFCDGFKALGDKMFYNCSSLETVVLPAGVTWLGVETFRNSGLISIVIPDSVEHIGEEAEVAAEVGTKNYLFADCARLTSVVLSSNLVTMSAYCFYNCAALESITYNGFEGEGNSLPKTLTVVGSYAFTNTQSLLQLDMPAVKDVGQYVFGDTDKKEGETSLASGIVTVSMPSLETVGVGLFRNCTALESVTLNNNLKALGSYMFANCTALKNITLPEELTYMSTYTFQKSGLTSIVIPSKVQHMGNSADKEALTSHANYLFDGCADLTSVTLPAGLLTMGSYTFRNCTSLASVTYAGYEGEYNALPVNLSVLGSNSFESCAIENIIIPEALEKSSSSVFKGCSLTTVVFNAINMTTTGVFKDMESLTTVIFGDKVAYLAGQTFYGCTNLQNVTLPDSIETIKYDAFRDCNAMTEIVLGKNVILDGGRVFWGWTEEQTIYVKQSAYMSFRLWSTSWMEECNATIVWDYVGTQESDS